jgi:predicted RND superfamily exporter protein
MLLHDHPARQAYVDFKDQFGTDNFILIPLKSDEIFTLEYLSWLKGLHEALEDEIPYIEEVTSLINVRSTRGEGDERIVDDLLEDWPQSEAEAEAEA